MQKISDQGRLRPWMGFVLFGVLMAFFILICAPLQEKLEIPGLVITEISFVVLAVLYCLVRKVKIREVFPVKKVKARDVMGCIILVLGTFPLAIMSVAVTAMILPWSVQEIYDFSAFIYGNLNYPMAILIAAILPAICEEAIHRGAILSNFRSIKHDWIIVLIMGLFFGINHLSVLRFLATTIIGIILSYVVVKKNNILLSMIMHFTNNLISLSMGYLTGQGSISMSQNVDFSMTLGVYLIIGFASPVLITLGLMLLNPQGHRKIRFLYAGIISVIMLASGFGIMTVKSMQKPVLYSDVSYTVTSDDKDCIIGDFDIEEERNATVIVMLSDSEKDYKVRIDGDSGSNIINADVPQGDTRMFSYNIGLAPDHYTATVIPDDNAVGEHPEIQITIR